MSRIAIACDRHDHQAAARVTSCTNDDPRRAACADFGGPATEAFPTVRLRFDRYSEKWPIYSGGLPKVIRWTPFLTLGVYLRVKPTWLLSRPLESENFGVRE
jgi:hypothetical protein